MEIIKTAVSGDSYNYVPMISIKVCLI